MTGKVEVPSRIKIDRELVRRYGLYAFVKLAWSHVEPAEYVDNWHIDEKCKHCEAVTYGKIRRLVINEPPGSSKSLVVCVFWPVWTWIVQPKKKFFFASFDPTLSMRDADRALQLLKSKWFQDRWGNLLAEENPAVSEYSSTAGGFRFSTSVGGKGTGRHADIQVVDDPTKPLDVETSTRKKGAALEKVRHWWRNTMPSRMVDFRTGARVVIMQRLAEGDLAGDCIDSGDYEHLCFPMRFVKASACKTSIGGDRRTVDGELLNPIRVPEDELKRLEKDMGPMVAAAQLGQKPVPAGGNIFKEEKIKHWTAASLPNRPAMQILISVDCAFKDSEGSDHVAIEVWGAYGGCYYLLDHYSEIASFTETCEAIKIMCGKWTDAVAVLVEDKANGSAVIDTLKELIPILIPIEPIGSKESRAHACSIIYEAGSVYHPDPNMPGFDWVHEKEGRLVSFPKARYDDDVDTTTQALLRLKTHTMSLLTSAMQALNNR